MDLMPVPFVDTNLEGSPAYFQVLCRKCNRITWISNLKPCPICPGCGNKG